MLSYKKIRNQFNKGCVKFNLLEDDDKILVGLSGGKDSLMLLQLLAERARIFKPHIEVEAAHVIMDNVSYEADNQYLQDFCKDLGVNLHILHASFEEKIDQNKSKCFLCSWNRRKALFQFAQKQGFNKIALGHHMDDFLITLLLNMTYEGSLQSMSPKLKLEHYPLTIIRPLCMVNEADIQSLAESFKFKKQQKSCPYEDVTKRMEMTKFFHQLEQINPEARFSMWHAIERNWEFE